MIRRTHQLFVKLLAVALTCASVSPAVVAQQQSARKSEPTPQTSAQGFSGSIFAGKDASKANREDAKADKEEAQADKERPKADKEDAKPREAESASPKPQPIPYMTVVARVTSRATDANAQTTSTQTPSSPSPSPQAQPSASPAQTPPAQSPQTASPAQTQTQQSTNPAAPAQAQPTAQPAVPPTAPPNPAPATQGATQPAPGAQVQPPAETPAPGRESVPAPAPDDLRINVPQIAPGFKADAGPFPTLERVGVDMGEQQALSVREAIELALANNKDIEVARDNVRGAEFDLKAARGVYDPRFLTNTYYERTEQPTASFLSGSSTGAVTQTGIFSTSSVQGQTPKFGGNYRVDFANNRITTNNQFAALNPQYPSSLTFSYAQPIFKGREFDQNRRLIAIARKNLSLTDAQFRQRAIETITNVQRAYWDLVYTLRNLQIQRDAVRDARSQLEHNRRLVTEGVLAPIDVVAAEAQVSGFEQNVYSALDDVGRAENNLKNLIAENRESAIWNVSIVPTDSVDLPPPAVQLTDAMQAALKSRPELQSADVAREINEIEQRFAREQTKPQLDLVASYGMVGLAGATNTSTSVNPLTASSTQLRNRINELSVIAGLQPLPAPPAQTIPGTLVGGEAQSLVNLAANRFTNFRVGVTVNLPFRNTTAEAQLGRTLVDARRIKTQREQLEQLIQVDVRNALQLVRTAESRLRAAAAARTASEQQYASEQRKLGAGQSTVFLVLERQTALTTARGNELRAQTELNKAIAELQRATGNALEQNRVEIQLK